MLFFFLSDRVSLRIDCKYIDYMTDTYINNIIILYGDYAVFK